jgi:hypothetical protein
MHLYGSAARGLFWPPRILGFGLAIFLGCTAGASTPGDPAAGLGETPTSPKRDKPSHDGKVVLFGNLHAHSTLSDDVPDTTADTTPQKGFEYARVHGLDFLAISDHHMAVDAAGRNWLTADEYQNKLFKVAMDFNAAHPGEFIAIPAIEWGNMSVGNHINIFGAAGLPPDGILNVEYDKLHAWIAANAEFAQFNHPHSWSRDSKRNKAVGNYGEARYANQAAFASAADPGVSTISIISTVAGGHITGAHKHAENKTYRKMDWEGYYRQYLNMGFHISPAANQDTHWKNFGTVTAARTAAWADTASYPDLMKAFKANRVYATEDDEMAVAFQVRYKGKVFWMGETVPLEAEEAEVELLVKVWQGQGTDGDPLDEGPYQVELVADPDGVGGNEASVTSNWTATSGAQLSIPFMAARGRYVYIHVREQGGKDNLLGDGEDTVQNATGDEGSDGKRDDQNDSAWTSPVWFSAGQAPTALFVWSKSSEIYHDANCFAVKAIGAANRRDGAAPPDGKRKHDCHP